MVSPLVNPKAALETASPKVKKPPQQARAKVTYENILSAAQDILDKSGIEAMNSNSVVAHAGVTAPIFYRYFNDKYDLLQVLAERLMRVQNEPFKSEVEAMTDRVSLTGQIYSLLSETLRVTENFKGSLALLLSLRALPNLSVVRRDENDRIAKIGAAYLIQVYPDMSKTDALRRSRLINEISYSVIEMLIEQPKLNRKKTLQDTAHAVFAVLDQ